MDTITPTPRKKKVIIALPGSSFSSKFLMSWTQTLFTIWQLGKYELTVCPGESSFVTFARMKTLGLDVLRGSAQKAFNDADFDVWVTIDSDVVFTPDQFIRLVDNTYEHNVVAGAYMMSDNTHLAVVKDWDHEFFVRNGSFQFLTPADLEVWRQDKNNTRFMPVSYVGMGFMAVTKKALDSLHYPFFNRRMEKIDLSNGVSIIDMCGEDVAFCKNLQKAGFDVYLDTELRVGHEKQMVL